MKRAPVIDRAAWALLVLFVFSIPFEKTVLIEGFGTASRLAGALAFGCGVAAVVQRRRPRRPNLALVFAAAFTVWVGLTRSWSLAADATEARFFTFLQLLAMTWLIWELCRTGARQRVLLTAYVAGAAVASAATIARYAAGRQTYYRRYAAAGFDPNDLGVTLALALPMAFYLALGGRARWLYYFAAALAIAAVLLTGSRTALVASFIAFAFAAATWRGADRSERIATAVLLGLLVLALVELAPAASRQRLSTLPSELTQGTLHSRTKIWKAGLEVFRRHPLRGIGAGAYPEAVRPRLGTPARAGHEYVAHNTFLSVLVEDGLIGAGILALLLATLAAFVWMLGARERALWFTMFAVWAAGVLTLTWEHRKPAWLMFALIMTAWARAFRDDKV